jgi:glycosyltransferase involved in cell wall biosynthesis
MFGRDGDFSVAEIRKMAIELAVDEVTAIPGFRLPVESNLAPLDLLLAPAATEPFGRALVEAIILGTPVVATRGAGHSEIIGAWGGGELGNESDTPEETAAMCLRILAEPDRYRLSDTARRDLAAQLTPDAHAERVIRVYERAARKPRRASPRVQPAHT